MSSPLTENAPVVSTNGPSARSGHVAVLHGKNQSEMILFGGFANGACFDDVHVLHLATGDWRALQTTGDVPAPVTSHSAVSDGNYLLCFGGTSADFGVNNSDKLHVLDVAEGKWSEIVAPGDKPVARYGHSMVLRPGTAEVYVFGGTTGQDFFNDVHCFDASSMMWRKVEPRSDVPSSRYRHTAVSTRTHMYVVGGGNNQPLDASKPVSIWSFNYDTCEWAEVETKSEGTYGPPVPRLCHTSTIRGGFLYVHGGTNGREIYGEWLWRLNMTTWKWTRLPSPTASTQLFFHAAVLTEHGRYVAFGGCLDRSGPHGVAQNRSNRVDSKWLDVPSLFDQCLFSLAEARLPSPMQLQECMQDCGVLQELEPMIIDMISPS
jgi:hypothetical protein